MENDIEADYIEEETDIEDLEDIDVGSIILSEEIKKHYQDLMKLKQHIFLKTTYAKPSERVSAMNSITKLLSQMTKDLERTHNAEKFEKAKQILIGLLKEVDEDIGMEFVERCKDHDI